MFHVEHPRKPAKMKLMFHVEHLPLSRSGRGLCFFGNHVCSTWNISWLHLALVKLFHVEQ